MDKSSSSTFWDKRIGDDPDFSNIGCAGFGNNYNRWLYRIRERRFRYLASQLPVNFRQARVLDIGSGTGFYLGLWQDLGVVAPEGLDFAASAVRHLEKKFPRLKLHRADIGSLDLPLSPGSYDVISAFDVLFHIVDDKKYAMALKNIARLLKPGGFFLFSENFTHHSHNRNSEYHFSRTLPEIRDFLDSSGLSLEFRRPMFFLMNAPDDSTRKLARWWWRLVSTLAVRGEKSGWIMGMLLYPAELVITRYKKESPTTEIAVCTRSEV